jgi:hypothetical protein
MAQCADYPDDIPVAEAIMLAEDDQRRELFAMFADDLQSMLPDPAPVWALRLLFRWRMEAAR